MPTNCYQSFKLVKKAQLLVYGKFTNYLVFAPVVVLTGLLGINFLPAPLFEG